MVPPLAAPPAFSSGPSVPSNRRPAKSRNVTFCCKPVSVAELQLGRATCHSLWRMQAGTPGKLGRKQDASGAGEPALAAPARVGRPDRALAEQAARGEAIASPKRY